MVRRVMAAGRVELGAGSRGSWPSSPSFSGPLYHPTVDLSRHASNRYGSWTPLSAVRALTPLLSRTHSACMLTVQPSISVIELPAFSVSG